MGWRIRTGTYERTKRVTDYTIYFVGVFTACKTGDLTGVKNVLPYVPEAINEIMNENGDNLLMWYVHSTMCERKEKRRGGGT